MTTPIPETHTTHPPEAEYHWPTIDPLDPREPATAWLRSLNHHHENDEE